MANVIYNSAKVELMTGVIDLDTDDIKIMLVTSAYTPLASHTKRSDVTNEVSGTGYTAGGQSLSTKSVSLTGTEAIFNSDPIVWSSSSITARGAVLYKSRGGASSSDELIAYFDFVEDVTSISSNFTITPNGLGIIGID